MLRKALEKYQVVLASQSPRRKELLGKLRLPFEILPAKGEEKISGHEPERAVMGLARQKAEEVYHCKKEEKDSVDRLFLVIGADTVVAYQNQILGKPRDREQACEMLHLLSGSTHQVYTGMCIVRDIPGGGMTHYSFYEKTDVKFVRLSDAEIRGYIDSGDPFDKAGGYGIQGEFAVYVQGICGDYNNVVGMPVARLYQELKRIACSLP